MIELTVTTSKSRWSRYELHIALVDGLFQPQKKIPRSDLQRRQIDAYYDWHTDNQLYPKAIHLQLLAPYNLGVEAETVLLALLYIAEQTGSSPAVDAVTEVPLLLDPGHDARTRNIGLISTTRYAVLKTAGMRDSQAYYARLDQYLRQLSQVWVYYHNRVSGWEGNDDFFRYRLQKDTDRLLVQFNWRLAGAVFGNYLKAYIDLNERHQLHTTGAKTLHRWLSAHLWPGKAGTLRLDTLSDHIWPEVARTPEAHRVRLHRLKHTILPDLAQLPQWEVSAGSEMVKISRHDVSV